MNVLLISQCSKNALTETRRILDQFAERRGDRTWQTPITWQGLDTLRRLLKKTARRNTAVACYWIRGKDHSELIWIVGDASRFNAHGATPTNTTGRDVLRSHQENDWHTAEDIRLLAAMAGLFHDFGKANQAFQKKLKCKKPMADALRHEWVSLRLFEAFVGDDTDRQWLERLAALPDKVDTSWLARLKKDHPKARLLPSPLKTLPPLARAVGWLVVSHHRLPMQVKDRNEKPNPQVLDRLPASIHANWCGWRTEAQEKDVRDCWTFGISALPLASRAWRSRARRLAGLMLNRRGLLETDWLDNSYVAHLSRLSLMLADHHYSSLTNPEQRRKGDPRCKAVLANTDRETKQPKQPLDEHLVGVAHHSARVARLLPLLARHLPRIARHSGFKKRNKENRFRWQDKAYELAASLQVRSGEQGFFGVNMASTGCGKTFANGRIMYALADPQRGARFSIALGLRVLTLQTGAAYRERLHLGSDDMAVLVGGAARALFEHTQSAQEPEPPTGSESAEALLPDALHVHYEGSLGDGPFNAWLEHTRGAKALLNAPVLVCTIDHLMPATEGVRGGRQIAPMLRLLSSDLVLDEPDEFDLDDLPALSRLVHWAGLLGSRVLLSSATLPPALIQGLFEAYRAGRQVYGGNRGLPNGSTEVCCAWFDEFTAKSGQHGDGASFMEAHGAFVANRLKKLSSAPVRRRAEIKPLAVSTGQAPRAIHHDVAEGLHELIHELHARHHGNDPHGGGRVSFGVVRMANIDPLLDVAQSLLAMGARSGHRIHLCCYHSQHPLLVRSAMEARLDRLLKRHESQHVFDDPELRAALDADPCPDQIFVVLATPVAEVGRDHDYDWGIVEPSSMRSIIQLAGRIWRHRPKAVCTDPNLYLLETNIKSIRDGIGKATYCRPGFERQDFMLNSHNLGDLLTPEQFAVIDAATRITERDRPEPGNNLVDLEHDRLRALMVSDAQNRIAPVDRWWTTRAGLSGELQRTDPFRYDPRGRLRYALVPDEDSRNIQFIRLERTGVEVEEARSLFRPLQVTLGPGIGYWGQMDYLDLLEALAEALDMEVGDCARRLGTLELAAVQRERGWVYHPALGFGSYRE